MHNPAAHLCTEASGWGFECVCFAENENAVQCVMSVLMTRGVIPMVERTLWCTG